MECQIGGAAIAEIKAVGFRGCYLIGKKEDAD